MNLFTAFHVKRRPNEQTWFCPSGMTWNLCDDILTQDHVIIGGTTGSGKSTLLHSIMYSALINSPVRTQFILIDLKGTELIDYERIPHTIEYADTPEDAVRAIKTASGIMEERIEQMKREHRKMYDGNDIYIVIDELAILMQTAKAQILGPLANIMRLGRAARVHVIGATQNPSRSKGGGCPSEIIQNATATIGLRCRSSIESRQIVGVNGAEKLPKVGEGLYWSSEGITSIVIPKTTDAELIKRIRYWENAKPQRRM